MDTLSVPSNKKTLDKTCYAPNIKQEVPAMKIIQRPSNDYIMSSKSVKDVIVWHFTAGGSLSGAEATLALPDTINVTFMIDDDGKIYQYMKEDQWAYHTGVNGAKDANGKHLYWCKRSFGVEIRNWGGLKLTDGLYLPYTNRKNQAVNPSRVLKLFYDRFGFKYYEALTPAQIDSVLWLDGYLRGRHPITTAITHADISKKKHDFPPDYPWLPRYPQDFYYTYNKIAKPVKPQIITYANGDPVVGTTIITDTTMPVAPNPGKFNPDITPIPAGKEKQYTKAQIQARINVLIKTAGWGSEELTRLIKYREGR